LNIEGFLNFITSVIFELYYIELSYMFFFGIFLRNAINSSEVPV